MRILSQRKSNVIYYLLFLFLYFYSYRYVFQYNYEGTSSTYSNTPVFFQIAKFLLLLLSIIFLLFQSKLKICWVRKKKKLGMLVSFLIIQMLINGIVGISVNAVSFSIILLPIILCLGSRFFVNVNTIEKILLYFWYFSAIYEFIQVFLYYTAGRLPALGYGTGKIVDVRFGGAWDDPNGYALLLFFYIVYFFKKKQGWKRLFFVSTSLLMLLMTWSLTSFLVAAIVFPIMFLLEFQSKINLKFFIGCSIIFVSLLGALGYYYMDVISTIEYMLVAKEGSVQAHLGGWDNTHVGLWSYLGLKLDNSFTEVGWLRILRFGGIPAVLCFAYLNFYTIKKGYTFMKKKTGSQFIPLVYGIIVFFEAFSISMFNLPQFVNFSCMGVWVIFFIIIVNRDKWIYQEKGDNVDS